MKHATKKSSRYVDYIYLYPENTQNDPVKLIRSLEEIGISPRRVRFGEGMNYLSFENDIYTIDFCRAYAVVFEKRKPNDEEREIIRELDRTLFKGRRIPKSWKYWAVNSKKLLWHDSDFYS